MLVVENPISRCGRIEVLHGVSLAVAEGAPSISGFEGSKGAAVAAAPPPMAPAPACCAGGG